MLTKRKKIIVLVVMFALLIATAVLNYTLALGASKDNPGDDPLTVDGGFYTQYRNERIASRNQEMAYLDEIIAMQGDEYATQRQEAVDSKMKLVRIVELETNLENILKAQGFEDAVVTIGLMSDNVTVMVRTEELTAQDNAMIYNLIYEEAQVSPDYVRIIPV